MSDIVKCNVCNIVIDELLAYIQNKVSVVDEETLIRLCTSSFTKEEIEKSKSLLYSALPADKRKIQRKRKGKENRDVDDIIGIIKSTDPDILPVYVAKQLEKLPPITFDHLDCTALLKDLIRLKSDIECIKSTYATNEQVDELKTEVNNLKYASILPTPICNIDTKRGAWNMDSGPIGLSHVNDTELSDNNKEQLAMISTNNNNNGRREYREVVQTNTQTNTCSNNSMQQSQIQRVKCVRNYTKQNKPVSHPSNVCKQSAAAVSNQLCDNSMQRPAEVFAEYPQNEKNSNESEWSTVKRFKNKYRFAGKTGVAKDGEGMFKAAVRMIPIFISNIHNDTKDDEIINYIRLKTNELA
ncbi:uncharacterized protein LOC123722214 [Papilio machaon]|uniref:uncharacterized protein LOC123722214 n=1 Tax=Papilio machaon TaxID=76193 RepID=UPI001E665106|nr:uncharacterized protein LOC123722214 [Papilio machaon]